MNVVVDGLMTNYQKTGDGKVLLFLHGWGTNSATFTKLIGEFKDNYTVLVPDLPGFGGTEAPPEAWTLDNYADFVADFLAKLGIRDVYGLIGHSFGGVVSIVGVSTGLLRPNKLIVLASAGVRPKRRVIKGMMRLGAKTAKIPLYLLPSEKSKKIKETLYSKAGSDVMLLPHMRDTFVKTVNQDVQKQAQEITVPALLIYGSKDKSTPPKHGLLINKAIIGSKLEIITDAGHFLHQEQSAEVGTLVENFLKGKV